MSEQVGVAQLGPVRIGDALPGGWEVGAVAVSRAEALFTLTRPDGERVTLSLPGARGPWHRGPFHPRVPLAYRPSPLPVDAFAAAGRALALRLQRAIGSEDPRTTTERWLQIARTLGRTPTPASSAPPPGDWKSALRRTLLDRPRARLRLAELLPPSALPDVACVLPWTSLEYGTALLHGPCCSDFQARPAPEPGVEDTPLARWRSPAMRAFRRAMAGDGHPSTCRPSCPRLAGRSDAISALELHGGPAAFVDNQVRLVEDLLAGRSEPEATPLGVTFPTTSFCNYDCLMCRFGEEGTLADERPPRFYDALTPLLPGLRTVTALGGEPLASPVFRAFLASSVWADHPQLRASLTTNGSYLTPKEQARIAHVRFANITVSLNAASEETYAAVNRGLPLHRVRANLDALLDPGRGLAPERVTYSMVLLKRNLHELESFAALCRADGVEMRFMLPMHDRHGQSIMTSRDAMQQAEAALRRIAEEEWAEGRLSAARRIRGEVEVLADRLARGVTRPLPDDGPRLPVLQ